MRLQSLSQDADDCPTDNGDLDMETTTLTITINVGGQSAVIGIPTREQLSAVSTVALTNGFFAQSLGNMILTADPGASFKVEFVAGASGKARSVRIVNMGGLSGKKIAFHKSKIVMELMTVALENQPIALLGKMTHSVNTGSFVVASTGNPQGDRLPSNVASREMALVP